MSADNLLIIFGAKYLFLAIPVAALGYWLRLLRVPASPKPLPQPSVITALEKFTECGNLHYGAVRYRCPRA